MIAFDVPGEPQGKGRARSVVRYGRDGKPITKGGRVIVGHHTPDKTVAYEGLIALAAKQAMDGRKPITGPVVLRIEAWHTVPASWSKKRRHEAISGLLRPTTKPDADNIAKAVGDGGNGVLWADDKQIVTLVVERRYAERPGLLVEATEA